MTAFLAAHPVVNLILAGWGLASIVACTLFVAWFMATARDATSYERGDDL